MPQDKTPGGRMDWIYEWAREASRAKKQQADGASLGVGKVGQARHLGVPTCSLSLLRRGTRRVGSNKHDKSLPALSQINHQHQNLILPPPSWHPSPSPVATAIP